MKEKTKRVLIVIAGIILFYSSFPFIYYGLFNVAYFFKEKAYYSDISNFIMDNAIVKNIIYTEDNTIIIWLSEIEDTYPNSDFMINEKNTTVLLASGFDTKVNIGDEITFVSSPVCYSNGYVMPIVALCIKGEELLSFDEGYKNLMKEYHLFSE